MKYRMFNGPIRYYSYGQEVPKLKYRGPVYIAIDPSKTNLAMVIGDPGGEVISIVEMTGNGWGSGSPMDTTDYCADAKDFIRKYLADVQVRRIGLEKAISKKGMMHHHSNMVLTEIRGALLSLFTELYGLHAKDVEVNNWSWKSAILPDGYRSQSEKGSKRYFSQYLRDLTYEDYHEADVTDCLCIYKYMVQTSGEDFCLVCQEVEETTKPMRIQLLPTYAGGINLREFEYNPSFTVEQNAKYYANHAVRSGGCLVHTSSLTMQEIYYYTQDFLEPSKLARMVVSL